MVVQLNEESIHEKKKCVRTSLRALTDVARTCPRTQRIQLIYANESSSGRFWRSQANQREWKWICRRVRCFEYSMEPSMELF